jgi:hypothetical protein
MTSTQQWYDPRVQLARRGGCQLNASNKAPSVILAEGDVESGLASAAQANQQNTIPVQLFRVVRTGSTDSWCGKHPSRDGESPISNTNYPQTLTQCASPDL